MFNPFLKILPLTILLVSCAANQPKDLTFPSQAQASSLSLDVIATPKPAWVMEIGTCSKIVGLAVIDSVGDVHNMPLTDLNREQISVIESSVPADHVSAYIVPCHDSSL